MVKSATAVKIGIGVAFLGGLGWWFTKGFINLPGEAVADQGREHSGREELQKFVYNSNPPTSGLHDPDWIRAGVYDTSQDKYQLIHSLEHGYVVVHYNCTLNTPDCDGLKTQLADFAQKMKLQKLLVQPNPEIDKPLVLTAWNRILKMDAFDEKVAARFVRAFRDRGPEATME